MQSAAPDDKLWYASYNEDRLRRPPKVMRLPRAGPHYGLGRHLAVDPNLHDIAMMVTIDTSFLDRLVIDLTGGPAPNQPRS